MKNIVFYPILFSINPILLLYAVNISDLPYSQLFPIILIMPVVILGLMWLLNKWLKDVHRVGFLVFVFFLWFYYYVPIGIFMNKIRIGSVAFGNQWIVFPLWLIIFILLSSGWLWHRISSPQTITLFLNIICILLVSISIVRIMQDLIPRYLYRTEITQLIPTTPESQLVSQQPDIYYVIVDGYARGDVLKELYHYDNSPLIRDLQERGFYVTSNSQTNYVQTALSLASSLNMEYLSGPAGSKSNHGQILGMIDHSRARLLLESMGYKSVAFSTGYLPTDLSDTDYYYSPSNATKSHDLEAIILLNSVLDPFIKLGWINPPISRYSAGQERVDYTFNMLENGIPKIDKPKFVFVHIIAPHPPFIFNQNGPITPNEVLILQGADTFQGTRAEYIQGYISDLTYINKRLVQAIDGIIRNSKIPPIIVVQADHGPDAYIDWSSAENSCLIERFSILNAYFLPDFDVNQLPQDITPVNTFPLIFNHYFKTQIDLVQNHEFFATWENSYPFSEVSELSQIPCNIR